MLFMNETLCLRNTLQGGWMAGIQRAGLSFPDTSLWFKATRALWLKLQ